MFDLDSLEKPDGSYPVTIDGNAMVFHYRTPDHYELLDFRRSSFELTRKMRDAKEAVNAAEDPRDVQVDIASADYEPVLDFILAHVVEVDGIGRAGEEVAWAAVPERQRKRLLRKLGPAVAFDILQHINSGASLSEDEGND